MTRLVPSFAVFGRVRVDAHTLASALAQMEAMIAARRAGYVWVANVHTTVMCMQDRDFATVNNEAAMVIPDGVPLVWYGRWCRESPERVTGPDLMAAFFGLSEQKGYTHFLYGSTESRLTELRARLARRWPAASVVGAFSPPFRPWTDADLQSAADMINAADPDVVWVGLGAPKQQHWTAVMRPRLKRAIMVGVGAAFDLHAGRARRAPVWMQRSGLEWLYRLLAEPRRLWRRYLFTNSAFLAWWLLEVVKGGPSRRVDPAAVLAGDGPEP